MISTEIKEDLVSQEYANLERTYSQVLDLNSYYLDKKIDLDLLATSRNDTINLREEIKEDQYNLIIVLSRQECIPCSEKISENIFSIIDTSSIRDRIFIVTKFENLRDYLLFSQANLSEGSNIYNVKKLDFINIDESFCFILNNNLALSNFFILEPNTISLFKRYYQNILKEFLN